MVTDKDLKNKTVDELEKLTADFGQRNYLAKTIFAFIHVHGKADLDEITTLSKVFRHELVKNGYYISNLKLVEKFEDPDGTVKYLFELVDGSRIESVVLTDEQGRRTLCISCQVGCKMNCAFCATGKLHFTRDMTAGEIADQVIQVERESGQRLGNLVYMGMGEPFDNYDEVMKSIRMLNDPAGKNIGARHITVSTCGIVDGIERFADEEMQVRLAISLHSAKDSVRQQIMGISRKYPVDEVLESVKAYQRRTGRRVTFEYIMIKGLNDSLLDARELVKLLRGVKCNVNLIEYNAHSGCNFEASDHKSMKQFQDVLAKAGIETAVRFKRGTQIKAACGQLGADWLKKSSKNEPQ